MSVRRMGLLILLASLAVLFAATIVAYLIVRFRTEGWAQGLPELPKSLYINTVFLLATSVALSVATRAAKNDSPRTLLFSLWIALVLAITFLVGQALSWIALTRSAMPPDLANLYAFTFYLLTGTHAVHVLAGFVPLGITIVRAHRGHYRERNAEGVSLTALYWHFLDGVWLILLVLIMI